MSDTPKKPMLAEVPKGSVRNLRAAFEKNQVGGKAKVLTPEQFFKDKMLEAEKEAQALLLARKKAAAYNMAIRKGELTHRKASVVALDLPPKQNEELRREARRVSVSMMAPPTLPNPMERRGTSLMLASMCAQLEEEMKHEELVAAQEEKFARERLESAVAIAEKTKAEELMATATKERELAQALQELARKEAEEQTKIQAEEEEKAKAAAAAKALADQQRAAETSEMEKDRKVLVSFLTENHPDKLNEVDMLLEKFKGNLEVLFEELGKAQTFEETPDVGPSVMETPLPVESKSAKNPKEFLDRDVDLRNVITNFYSIYAKSKLAEIDGILKHFEGRDSDLFRTLEVKYDVSFSSDGTCVPNDGLDGQIGVQTMASQSKFAVDVQARALKERLAKQGNNAETVNIVLSTGSGMM